jgi:acetyltransferase-like isoleucine patch superfamily enzyme
MVNADRESTDSLAAPWRSPVVPNEDPLLLFSDLVSKMRTTWMRFTYPFAAFGRGNSIHYSCEIRRPASNRIRIGDSVYLAPGTWLNVPEFSADAPPVIILESGCKIGRQCMISAKNMVFLENDVMLGPSVVITDHSHAFSNVDLPIHAQGLTTGGTVRIERNCWLGYGAAVVCTSGDLILGRNSVVGANSVVTRSVPPFSVVAGNPAKLVRRYDPDVGKWIRECTF